MLTTGTNRVVRRVEQPKINPSKSIDAIEEIKKLLMEERKQKTWVFDIERDSNGNAIKIKAKQI